MPYLYPLLALSTSFFITAPQHVDVANFGLSSSGFIDRRDIPTLYTCDGRDVSPAISWHNAPEKTQSFALICHDPDVPAGVWYHWVIYNIPKHVNSIPQGGIPNGAVMGKNSWGRMQYNGPCPPSMTIHRYVFNLYALDAMLSLPNGVDARTLQTAMQGHVLAKADIFGVFGH